MSPSLRISAFAFVLIVASCGTDAGSGAADDVAVDTVSADGADTDAPDTDAPDTDAPDTDAPDTDAPDTDAPDTDAPDTDAPDTDEPDTAPDAVGDTEPGDVLGDTTETGVDAADTSADVGDTAPDVADTGADTAVDASPDTDLPGDGAVLVPFDPEAMPPSTDVFSLGVQAGAMRANSVQLWTFNATDADIVLRVWRASETPGEVWMVIDDVVRANREGYVRTTADGLLPGTWYHYVFATVDVDGTELARSPVGRVRTALAPGSLEPLRVAATSCTNDTFAPFEALEAMATQEYDLFLHMGDQSYNDGAESLREFRDAWRRTLTDPGYSALHRRTGWYGTWDDHEVDDNWNPESIDASIRDNAFQAYFETLAVERQDSGALWHSYAWGDTAEFFVLDCRSERRASTRGGEDIYISPEQMAWLQDGLRNSTAHFKVILNSVPITDMPPLYIAENDRWEGYGRQRSALLDMIEGEGISNVWFLSGDFHIGFVARVDGNDDPLFEIAVGPGANSNPVASTLGLLFSIAGRGDQLLYNTGSLQTEMQTFLTFDPARDAVRVEFIDASGRTQFDEWLQQEAP